MRRADVGKMSRDQSPLTGSGDDRRLPIGWRWVELGELVESMKNGLYKPASQYADDGIACLRMYNIDGGRIVWRDVKRMRLTATELEDYRLLPGDLLVNRVNSRELVGKSALIPSGLEPTVFESKNIRLRLRRELVEPAFLNYRLLDAGSQYFNRNAQQVVGMASVSQPQVARFPVPLPPLDCQHEIVAELDAQFTRLDAGVAVLGHVRANLKRYRAAVLKAACEGRLVPIEAELARREGRSYETGAALVERLLSERQVSWSGRGKYTKPIEPAISGLGALPDGWTWVTVDQVLRAELCNGVSVKGSDHPPGVRALRLSAMSNSGFDYDDVRYLPLENSDVDDLFIVAGDFFVSRGNGSLHLVGRGTSAQLAPEPTIFPDTMIRLRFVSTAQQTRWLPTIWASPVLRRQIEGKVKTTAGIYKISQPQLAAIVIPLPPLDEQIRIVAEVERRVSVLQELETVVSLNLQRATRLRQSVLQRAFSGARVSKGRDLSCQGDVVRRPSAEGLR